MKKIKFSSVLISLALITLGVTCYACISYVFRKNETQPGCRPLAEGFSEQDLVGTWIARSIDISDTLIIRADNTFRQIIHIGYKSLDYESGWQRWWYERRKNGTGYLHLVGLRICAADTGYSCDWLNDGKIPWADVCESQWMDPGPTAGEIILVVYGFPFLDPNEKISHPFSLSLFKGFESSSWDYNYQGP
jgi:hypothetical protein